MQHICQQFITIKIGVFSWRRYSFLFYCNLTDTHSDAANSVVTVKLHNMQHTLGNTDMLHWKAETEKNIFKLYKWLTRNKIASEKMFSFSNFWFISHVFHIIILIVPVSNDIKTVPENNSRFFFLFLSKMFWHSNSTKSICWRRLCSIRRLRYLTTSICSQPFLPLSLSLPRSCSAPAAR